jgi:hypothetical protein
MVIVSSEHKVIARKAFALFIVEAASAIDESYDYCIRGECKTSPTITMLALREFAVLLLSYS